MINHDSHDDAPLLASHEEEREARLTAYALGQVDAAEQEEIKRLLAEPEQAEARRQVADVRAIAVALQGGIHEAGGPRSPDLRRAVLAAAARPQPTKRRAMRRGWLLLAGALAASLLVAIALPSRRTEPAAKQELAKSLKDERLVAAAPPAAVPAAPTTAPSAARPAPAATTPAEPRAAADKQRTDADDALRRALAEGTRAEEKRDVAAGGARELQRARDGLAMIASNAVPEPKAVVMDRARDEEITSTVIAQAASRKGEGYATVVENRPVSPKDHPLSTFSIDVDTASYANVRRFLSAGQLPPRDAVRIEELVNYFRYDYPQPAGDAPFSVTVDAAECPWHRGRRLMRIGLQGRVIDRGARPAGNLVFLIDVSGSMQAANKLPLVRQALTLLVDELGENDRVSIVTYAGNAGLVLPPTTGDQKQTIRAAIESLSARGSTHGSAGIALAYEQAREHFVEGGANRVILATDGDLNVGVTSTSALTDLITEKAKGGVFLTVLGFGEGNLQDEKMEALADNGNGVYAYIDGLREARKVLVEQLTGSTVTIAKDVKIQVEFNPAQVASYRLLGYENRSLAARDFRDDAKDAGDIGAGHSVTALYEITLMGDGGGDGVEPLKYQPRPEPVATTPAHEASVDPAVSREMLTVKLRWKRPEATESTGLEVVLADRGTAFDAAPADFRFAAAVAAYGMILRSSDEKGDATLGMVTKIAGTALGRDDGGYRAEFLDLVRRTEPLRGR